MKLNDHEIPYRNAGSYPEPWLLPNSLRPLYRFLLGRPMSNAILTNATFWHPASAGYPSWWLRLPGWKRAGLRLLAVYLLALGALMLMAWAARAATGAAAPSWALSLSPVRVLTGHLVAGAVVAAPFLVARWVRDYGISVPVPVFARTRAGLSFEGWSAWEVQGRREWEQRYVQPLALAIDAVLGTTHRANRADRWITVPRNFRDQDGDPVVVLLPPWFTGADRGVCDRLVRTVAARLGLRDPAVTWQLEGNAPRVLLSAPPTPPRKVCYADVAQYLEVSQEYRPLLGIAARGQALTAEMVNDSPHIALSAGSGAGKSELTKLLIMQALRWGWGVVVLDWKEVSQEWAEGLPGVRIVRDLGDIHEWLVGLGEDLDARKRAYRSDPALPGRSKVLVVYEEMNATSDLLAAYWQDLRATEPDPDVRRVMPVKSPALRAQGALVFGGRQFGIHCLFMAQRFSNRVTQGNTDIRENFQIKLMARYSTATVKMLAPDIKPFPKRPERVGGWVAVMGGEAVVFQAPLISTEEAREYALGGEPNPDHPLGISPSTHRAGRDCTLEDSLGHDPTGVTAGSPVMIGDVVPAVDRRKLSDMVDSLAHLGITLEVLRNEVKRDQAFPKPVGGSPNKGWQYDFAQVQQWARERHARMQAERRA